MDVSGIQGEYKSSIAQVTLISKHFEDLPLAKVAAALAVDLQSVVTIYPIVA